MQVKAPMVGKLVSIDVNVGDKVKENDTLATLEAMKMIIKIFAPLDGEIKEIFSSPGAVVDPDTPIVALV